MGTFLRDIQLRNRRTVIRAKDSFIVTQTDRRGTRYSQTYPKAAVDKLYSLTRGETVSKDEAADRLRRHAVELGLKYHYGWRLNFVALDILVVFVATGRASVTKEGNRFVFQVR